MSFFTGFNQAKDFAQKKMHAEKLKDTVTNLFRTQYEKQHGPNLTAATKQLIDQKAKGKGAAAATSHLFGNKQNLQKLLEEAKGNK